MDELLEQLAISMRNGLQVDVSNLSNHSIDATDFATLVSGRGIVGHADMHPRGLTVVGLHITGDIDWSHDRWCSVHLFECNIDANLFGPGLRIDGEFIIKKSNLAGVNLGDARIDGDFSLAECIIGSELDDSVPILVNLNSLNINGTLHMESMTIYGSVDLRSSHITHAADFRGSQIVRVKKARFLSLESSKIATLLSFGSDGIKTFAGGRLVLNEANIGSLHAVGAKFIEPGGIALSAEGVTTTGYINLDGIIAEGCVSIERASIAGGVSMRDASLNNPLGIALCANNLKCMGPMYMHGMYAVGTVSLIGSSIAGQLVLNGALLAKQDGDALTAFGTTISGGAFLNPRDGGNTNATVFRAYGRVSLKNVTLASLESTKSQFFTPSGWAFDASGLISAGQVNLDLMYAAGGTTIAEATVGNLRAVGATFINPGGSALLVSGLASTGVVNLDGILAEGIVDCDRASLVAGLWLRRASLNNADGYALSGNGLKSTASIFMHGINAVGTVGFIGALIDGQIIIKGGSLASQNSDALTVFEASISGGIWLTRLDQNDPSSDCFRSYGRINLSDSKMKSLYTEDSQMLAEEGSALNLAGAEISGEVVLSGEFVGDRATDFSLAQIKNSLMFTSKFTSYGLVRMETAAIGGSVIVERGANFYSDRKLRIGTCPSFATTCPIEPLETSLHGASGLESIKWSRVNVRGRVEFGFHNQAIPTEAMTTIQGDVWLDNITVGEDLGFDNVLFDDCDLLVLNGAKIAKRLRFGLDNATHPQRVYLRGVEVDELVDGAKFWGIGPDESHQLSGLRIRSGTRNVQLISPPEIDIVNFTYSRFAATTSESDEQNHGGVGSMSAKQRLLWIGIQTRRDQKTSYVPQPYQQLAEVYQSMGRDGERRDVLVAQLDDLRKFGELSKTSKVWNWFMSTFAAHGYRPLRSFGLTMAIFLLSVVCVWIPKHNDAFVASVAPVTHWKVQGNSMDFTEFPKSSHCTSEYPCLNEWLYTLDAVIPVVDLQQTPYWSFDKSLTVGWFFQILFALLTVFGWISTSIFVIVISGIVSKA